jgi:hypothetical protein
MAKKPPDEYSKQEAAERLAAALRGARVVGHKPQSEMKLGRRSAKKAARRAKKD